MKKIVFALLLLLHPFAIAQNAVPRIVGGDTAPRGAYPWMVALLDDSGDISCGGTLIRADVVLTAAHCVNDVTDPSQLNVRLGAYDLQTWYFGSSARVIDIIIHPAYDPYSVDNDIALLQLDVSHRPSITRDDLVELVAPATMSTLNVGTLLTTMGWGAMDDSGSPTYPQVLREVDVPYISPASCASMLTPEVTSNMLCAGELDGGKDSCGGDSGGPLVYDYHGSLYQVGIVSWGDGCGQPEQPGVYTRLVNYVDWISQILDSLYVPEVYDYGFIPAGGRVGVEFELRNWSEASLAVQSVSDVTDSNGLVSSQIFVQGDCLAIASGQTCVLRVGLDTTVSGRSETVLNVVLSDLSERTITITGDVLGGVDVANALGEGDQAWYTGVDAVWQEVEEGDRTVFRSGSIGDLEESVLMAQIEGPGFLVFDWQVSSERHYDALDFIVNGERHSQISGEKSWQSQCASLVNGRNDLIWIYHKDGNASAGRDTGAIDNVVFIPEGEPSPCSRTDVGNKADTESDSGGGGLGWLALLLFAGVALRTHKMV